MSIEKIERRMEDKQEDSTKDVQPAVNPEEEDSVTMEELFQDMAQQEETAKLLFGAQNPSVCTFPEGYVPRQTVFTCLTCTQAPISAGFCYGCSLNCHDGHNIVELYTKRKFRCDCGNSKFGDFKCTLYEEKDGENVYNMYNHNYNGKFCSCDAFYPDDEMANDMLQCEICEDWYHETHLKINKIPISGEGEGSEAEVISSLICPSCVKKLPFLAKIPPGDGQFCFSKSESSENSAEAEDQALEISRFRSRLCKCSECFKMLENVECEFLMDVEDDIGTFEMESKKKAEAENQKSDEDEMRELVKEVGMDGAQLFYKEVDNLKRKLGDFINKTGEGGKSISAGDVNKFFSELQEERFAKKRREFE